MAKSGFIAYFQKNRAGLLTNGIFESIFSAQVYSLWYFVACMPEELTMKKDVAASAAEAVAPKKPEFSLIDEDLLKSRIYTIRGVKVMLDADLAEIYGYSTKAFNQQVKNNIERFAKDFRFQLSKKEVEELRSKNLTAITGLENASASRSILTLNKGSRGSNIKYAPFVFTEQGIYMLMTVLKGDLAIQQSMALIRLFKQMKDCIAAENAPDVSAGMVALATQTSQNTRDIAEIATDVRTLSTKVERNESFLQKVMAKKSVLIVDDYLDVKTLDLLRCVEKNVSVKIFSEQHGRTRLTESMLAECQRRSFKFFNSTSVMGTPISGGNIYK